MTTRTARPIRTTVADAHIAIAARQAFIADSMSAEWTTSPFRPGDDLAFEERGQLMADTRDAEGQQLYVVYSYATPIAWVLPNGTVRFPAVRYSMTTSRHQGQAARGLDVTPAYPGRRPRLGPYAQRAGRC